MLDALAALGISYDDVTAAAREPKASRSSSCPGTNCWTPSTAALERRAEGHPMSFDIVASGAAADAVRAASCRASSATASPPASPPSDDTLWGPDAEAEAGKRLGWTEAVADLAGPRAQIVALRECTAPRRGQPHRACAAWADPRSLRR